MGPSAAGGALLAASEAHTEVGTQVLQGWAAPAIFGGIAAPKRAARGVATNTDPKRVRKVAGVTDFGTDGGTIRLERRHLATSELGCSWVELRRCCRTTG